MFHRLHFSHLEIFFSVSSNMIEQPTVEAAVQECSQASDETMYGDVMFLFGVYGGCCVPSFLLGNKHQAFSAVLHVQ